MTLFTTIDYSIAVVPDYLKTFAASGRAWAARWNKRAGPGVRRTPAALDSNVNVTLPRLWAAIQPQERRDTNGCIAIRALPSMRWSSDVAPGLDGVRTLVVTLLNWGANAGPATDERLQWRCVAADVAQVLRIVANKAGQPKETGSKGRTKYVQLSMVIAYHLLC